MTETPSGNRWEPTDDTTRPLASTPPAMSPPTVPPTTPSPTTPSPTTAEPVAAPEYGWVPAPQPLEAEPPPRGRRRTGALAAGAAARVIGATAGGYAIGSATSGSDRQDFGTTRQAPPGGFAPGQGFPDREGSGDDDHDHGPFGGPDDSTDDGS